MLVLDGVYVSATDPIAAAVFRRVSAPTAAQLQRLLERISRRVGRHLERCGWLQRDEETVCMDNLRGHSITYRVAVGRHQGKKAFTLRTLLATGSRGEEHLAIADGFSLVFFSPLDFIARLASLVPKPRVNLTRFHGVFAPNSKLRSQVTLSGRGKRLPQAPQTAAERHQAMSWAQRSGSKR